MYSIDYAACSDVGRVRCENQDAWFACESLGLFGVSDGMGGRAAGRLASRIVAETMPGFLKKHFRDIDDLSDPSAGEAVRAAVMDLSDALANESATRPDLLGMGSTVVMAVVRDGQALFVHLGDSRAYLLRNRRLQQKTVDHNLAAVIDRSRSACGDGIDREQAKSTLTRYVGMAERPEPDIAGPVQLYDGDRLLFCTDGLTNHVDVDDLTRLLHTFNDPKHVVRELIASANARGGTDNSTALVLHVHQAVSVRGVNRPD